MHIFRLESDHIELFKLLKAESLAASGGEAKFIIAEGLVHVNGETETRKRRKLRAGDRVDFNGETIVVQAASGLVS